MKNTFSYLKPRIPPAITERSSKIINMKKTIFAILAAPAAIPPKPNMAAIIAMMKKIMAKRNITINFSG
ncbi:hypothetical protein [Maribellus maritimus]